MTPASNTPKTPDYWRYAASVDHCNAVIRRHEEQIAYHKDLLRQWRKRRDNAIREEPVREASKPTMSPFYAKCRDARDGKGVNLWT